MATIIPITTNTTIAACIQIQVGDIALNSLLPRSRRVRASAGALCNSTYPHRC
jgi:hypothetical protein